MLRFGHNPFTFVEPGAWTDVRTSGRSLVLHVAGPSLLGSAELRRGARPSRSRLRPRSNMPRSLGPRSRHSLSWPSISRECGQRRHPHRRKSRLSPPLFLHKNGWHRRVCDESLVATAPYACRLWIFADQKMVAAGLPGLCRLWNNQRPRQSSLFRPRTNQEHTPRRPGRLHELSSLAATDFQTLTSSLRDLLSRFDTRVGPVLPVIPIAIHNIRRSSLYDRKQRGLCDSLS